MRRILLASLMVGSMPAISMATRHQSDGVLLASRLKHIGDGLLMYVSENDLAVFPVDRLDEVAGKYLREEVGYNDIQKRRQLVQHLRWLGGGLVVGGVIAAGVIFFTNKRRPMPVRRLLVGALCAALGPVAYILLFVCIPRPCPTSHDYVHDYVFIENVRAHDGGEVILAYEKPYLRPHSRRLAILRANLRLEQISRADLHEHLEKSRVQMRKHRR